MDDSPRRDDELLEIRQRLTALEQRLASLEEWLALVAGHRGRVTGSSSTPTPVETTVASDAGERGAGESRADDAGRADATAAEAAAAAGAAARMGDAGSRQVGATPSSFGGVVAPSEPPPEDAPRQQPRDQRETEPALDFEALVGRNLASWAGGIVLLLGICFFLKYAWDRGWIRPPPSLRVALAVLLGVIVCGLGEWVWRRRMRGLAATLHGTGVAILMTSFFGANRYFEPPVLSRGLAFLGVALAAAAGIFLALRVDVMTVAILSLIGAYLSPAILSSGVDKSLELLSYLAVLAAVAWVLSFIKGTRLRSDDETRFHWLAVRWIALAASYLWFFSWWNHFGEDNRHHFLAQVWLAFIYCGFLGEAFLTLQVAMPRMPVLLEMPRLDLYLREFGYPVGPPRADTGLAVLSLLNTALAFAAVYMVLEDEPQSVVALIALALAAVQATIAIFTVSRPMMWGAMLQSAALITLAVPLWFDGFSITMAWMVLSLALAALGWQLNLPAARAWAIALLALAAVRLVVADSSSPTMRAVLLTIGGEDISRWLLMAWVIAIQFQLIAWMEPRGGKWPAAEAWLRDAHDARLTLASHKGVARTEPVLDYARPPVALPQGPAGTAQPPDSAGIFLALIGTTIFVAAAATRWKDSALTLLCIVWLLPIVLLEPRARRIGYGTHATLLVALLAVHWFIAENLDPLLRAWHRAQFDTLLPIVNLPAFNGLLLAAAIVMLTVRSRRREPNIKETGYAAAGVLLFALVTFETWRLVEFIINRGVAVDDPAMAKQMATSVLWSVVGFTCVLVGFWRRLRGLRHAALWLLAVTLAKIFLVDMKDVKAVWRILSFVALGSLLLGVSYLYHHQHDRRRRGG